MWPERPPLLPQRRMPFSLSSSSSRAVPSKKPPPDQDDETERIADEFMSTVVSTSSNLESNSSAAMVTKEYEGLDLDDGEEEEEDDDDDDEEKWEISSAQEESTDDYSDMSLLQVKEELLELIPRLTGKDEEEYRRVEALVNTLEDRYQPIQTLDFFNVAQQGDWQLLFGTQVFGTPNPSKFRLREMLQRIECGGTTGRLVNQVTWDLSEATNNASNGNNDGTNSVFGVSGTFTIQCRYNINQGGARMVLNLEDHVIKLAPGSEVPEDVPALVAWIHRSMPKELFDPTHHAVDTTYLDADLRIVRYTGPRFEGVRDIFIRKGSWEVNPTAPTTATANSQQQQQVSTELEQNAY